MTEAERFSQTFCRVCGAGMPRPDILSGAAMREDLRQPAAAAPAHAIRPQQTAPIWQDQRGSRWQGR
jgi:hypothetical protein